MKVSIIIPVKPGGEVKALHALAELDYPNEQLEILVAEGCQPSVQRNRAAALARGEILYFLDDDAVVSPHFLDLALSHYSDPMVAAVGGPSLTPDTDTPLQQAIGYALVSVFGGGGIRNRYRKHGTARSTTDKELILCNLSFRAECYRHLGGLDERLYPNEENELMERLHAQGYKLIHDPDLAVYRSQRGSFKAYCRQMITYGRGRGEQSHIVRRIDPIALIPSAFVAYLCALPFMNLIYSAPLLCYAITVVFCAATGSLKGKSRVMFLHLLRVLPAMHILYGLGVVWGLLSPRFRKRRPVSAVTVRNIDFQSVKSY